MGIFLPTPPSIGTGGGVPGANGWTPVVSVVSDSARRVLKIIDWTGGSGTKPAINKYVGADGLTAVLADAVDIRGAAGATGAAGSNGSNGTNGYTILHGTNSPTTEGVNGDFYLHTGTWTIYGPKASGTWPSGVSLVGPTGAAGSAGTNGSKGADLSKWNLLNSGLYTAAPASTSTITFDDVTGLVAGMPLKYVYDSTAYYGVIKSITGSLHNYTVTIMGAPLVTGGAHNISALYYGVHPLTVLSFHVPGYFADDAADLLQTDNNYHFAWRGIPGYVVGFSAWQVGVDATAQPKVNVKVGSGLVSTNDSNNGIQLGSANTEVRHSTSYPVAINTTNYKVSDGDAIEVRCTVAGTARDALHLTVQVTIVPE